ncbi:MAG: YcjX family protein [Oceanospirillaceae bacterium]|nr:YcjX family protein [Oceanospirillaceae bacterium]
MANAFLNRSRAASERLARDIGIQIDRLRDRRLCLGVTGLSRSGKTTFIASLVHQLLQHKKSSLPGFSPVMSGRLLDVRMHPLEDPHLPPFPYRDAWQQLSGQPPAWPEPTRDSSGCLLELRLGRKPGGLNPFARDHFSLWLEIRDYPGEWLLDLPLRETGFRDWSLECGHRFAQSPRAALAPDLLQALAQIDPFAEADTARLAQLQRAFRDFLAAAKAQGLSQIQPGRFLLPGRDDDAELMQFVPLPGLADHDAAALDAASERSWYTLCRKRYERYVRELVEPFYRHFFSRIDRQLVLVDVVSALNGGPAMIDDMREALTRITDSFHYGRQHRLMQLFRPRIDRVLYAATKIDQVISDDHEAVRAFLASLVSDAYRHAEYEGIQPACEATSAVRCSREVEDHGDRALSGFDTEGRPVGYVHPRFPSRLPDSEHWQRLMDWEIPPLRPPAGLSARNDDAIPHIRLDTVLNLLLGDKCV